MNLTAWDVIAAFVLDLCIGDPHTFPHPVRWIGKLISAMERILYPERPCTVNGIEEQSFSNKKNCIKNYKEENYHRLSLIFRGIILVFVVLLATLLCSYSLISFAFSLSSLVGHGLLIWLIYTTIATRSLHMETTKVVHYIQTGNLNEARRSLSLVVSRDTHNLDEQDVMRSAIETLSENISDGVFAPFFYLALGGPIGALLYKAVNTMDSMIGYKTDRYRYFGWCAARLDDVLNYIPARLTAGLIMISAWILRLQAGNVWRIVLRDAHKVSSPNAGFPQAAMAGAIGVRLGGRLSYFGKVVNKPHLGDPIRPTDLDAYQKGVKVLYCVAVLSCFLAVVFI